MGTKAKYKNDTLGTRMKENYEARDRHYFPRRSYTLIRVDGRAFHTWTRGLAKPYDLDFMACMDAAAIRLCEEIAGARFAFVQSDEISVLATDFDSIDTEAWFDGNQSKIESITASIATMAFNLKVMQFNRAVLEMEDTVLGSKKAPNATFDSRAWMMADPIEVENYFIWRQKDAERNSVTMLASSYASHKQLHGKSVSDRHEVIHKAGDNWANHPARFKHGGVVLRNGVKFAVTRDSNWVIDPNTPVFTRDRSYLSDLIPRLWAEDAVAAGGK